MDECKVGSFKPISRRQVFYWLNSVKEKELLKIIEHCYTRLSEMSAGEK